ITIAQTISALSGDTGDRRIPKVAKLDTIVAVVDAARLVSEFGSGNSLLNKDIEEHDIEALIIQQIEFCNVILINKTDLVKPEELEQVKKVVKVLQPQAKIIETTRSQIDLSEVLGTNSFDFNTLIDGMGWVKALDEFDAEKEHHNEEHHHEHDEHNHEHCDSHNHEHDEHCDCDHEHGHCCCGHHHEEGHSHTDEFGITTFVYYRRKPFDNEKLEKFAENWPRSIIRSKGIIWFNKDNQGAYVFEQAGQQKSAEYYGDWMATASKREIEKAKKADPEFAKNWDEKVGDRMIKLVFIGKNMDKEKICKDLDACTVDPIL
ncbi:MAG: GTP-binding protein, partial [Spirochaetaceae bacterium]|nr:GTP-binding protein [Spirochaetaceae bacterium]